MYLLNVDLLLCDKQWQDRQRFCVLGNRVLISLYFQILTPFMLRRLKTDVDLEIPPKKELIVYCPLTALQKDLYETTVNRSIFEKAKSRTV
jgi:SNF2 family DNA or RNA helicase